MLRLIILRHATAEPARSGQSDFDRALSPTGRREAGEAGRRLRDLGELPDRVLCSTAVRTRQTAELALAAFPDGMDVRFLQRLYDDGDYIQAVTADADAASSILVIGHNPFVQETAISLAASRAPGPEAHFPPAAFALFAADIAWADLRPGSMQLERFVRPDA